MQHKNVADAFDLLLGEVAAALEAIREEGAQAFRRGDSRMVRTLTARAEAVGGFLADLRARQKEWKRLISGPGRPPKTGPKTKRVARGTRTPQWAYRVPILRALVAMGGEGRTRDALARVYSEMKAHLKPVDLQRLSSPGRMPRWRNAAMFERSEMKEDRLLRVDSPRGIWAITEKGRAYLRQHGQAVAPAVPEVTPPPPQTVAGTRLLTLKGGLREGIAAQCYMTADERGERYTVCKGSKATARERPHLREKGPGIPAMRRDLAQQGVLTPVGNYLEFTRDYEFTSPSMAAAVILGRTANGNISWTDNQGRPLGEFRPAKSKKG